MINQKDLPCSINNSFHRPTHHRQRTVLDNNTASSKIRLDKLFRLEQPKILIIRKLGGIGDVLMSTPLIKELKRLIPHCHITYATDLDYAQGSLADVINHCPYVDELISFGSIKEEYDYTLDITSTGLSRENARHVVLGTSNRHVVSGNGHVISGSSHVISSNRHVVLGTGSSRVVLSNSGVTLGSDIPLSDCDSVGCNDALGGRVASKSILSYEEPEVPNRIDMFGDAAGLKYFLDMVPVYVLSAEEIKESKVYLDTITKNTNKPIIVVQPRSNDVRRSWPAENVNALCSLLSNEYFVIVMEWGKGSDKWFRGDSCVVLADLEFNLAAGIIHHSDLVICPDSALLHLAGALRKDTIALFGPIPASSRINHYRECTAIQFQLNCGCWYTPKCKDDDRFRCLKLITPELVYSAAKNKLNGIEENKHYLIHGRYFGSSAEKILVKRDAPGLGDLLMASNGIEALKRQYPNAEIHVAIKESCFPALENNPNVDKIIDVTEPINTRQYSYVFDITSPCSKYEYSQLANKRAIDRNRTEIYAAAMGVKDFISDLLPRYYPTQEELKKAKKLLKKKINRTKPVIGLTIRSAEKYRDWPLENAKELCELLSEEYNIINLSPGAELPAINIKPEAFRDTAAIIALCDLLITVDTGPLHVGAALRVPTVALFGPIDYKARCRGYQDVTAVVAGFSCSPCWRNRVTKCKKTGLVDCYSECMIAIPAKNIFNTVKRILEAKNGN